MPADAAPVAAIQPDPPQTDQKKPVPEHVGRVLGLLRTFLTYGRKLADTLRHHADNPYDFPGFFSVASIFRTADVSHILDRIARGLLRAAALEDRLNRLATCGRDLTIGPIRMPAERNPPAGETAAAPMDDLPDDPAPQADPAALPTTEDIIARDRRRPIGAVLVDICHDLGIAPGQVDRATWNELIHHVIGYGGSLVTLLFKRPLPPGSEDPDTFQGYFTGPIPRAIALAPWPTSPFPDTLPPISSDLSWGCTGPP